MSTRVVYDRRHREKARANKREYPRCVRCWFRASDDSHHLFRFRRLSPYLALCDQCHDVCHWWGRRIEDVFAGLLGIVGARRAGRQIGKKFLWLATLWSIAYRTVIQAALLAAAGAWLLVRIIEGPSS